jgi:hypothetical protein
MSRFFVQISDDFPCIENIQNKQTQIFDSSTLSKILKKFDPKSLFFVVNEEVYDIFKDFYTIGNYEKCDIVLINDANIDNYKNIRLSNVYLFINDESKMFDNFKKIYENVDGFIEFKMMNISNYDEKILEKQIAAICDVLYELEKIGSPLIVKQLNGYKMTPKFQEFGEWDYFIGVDGKIYFHPSFYYSRSDFGVLTTIDKYEEQELNIHFTRPHLICVNCESFYCDRNIFNNKILTGEYKVPCIASCKMTTIFSKFSKMLLNKILEETVFDPLENLDRVDLFEATVEYEKFQNKETKTNRFKELNFDDRKLWSQND